MEIQTDRNQRVIDTGPFAVVRHPLYASASLMIPGASLLLGLSWALAVCGAMVVLLVVRIIGEERMLIGGLPDYVDYRQRVRCRLLHGAW